MAKKVAKKVAPKVTVEDLEAKLNKLEDYLNTQVAIKNNGGDNFVNYLEL